GDGECGGATPACQPSGACSQCSATNPTQCSGATPVCYTPAGTCVACPANAQCGGAAPGCSTATHSCRACAGDSACGGATPAGRYLRPLPDGRRVLRGGTGLRSVPSQLPRL